MLICCQRLFFVCVCVVFISLIHSFLLLGLSVLRIPLSVTAVYIYFLILYHYAKCIFSNPGYYVGITFFLLFFQKNFYFQFNITHINCPSTGKPIAVSKDSDSEGSKQQSTEVGEDKEEEKEQRVCLVCKHIKGNGVHHCSTCGKCVESMDHHCPFTANCVGKNTYKYFMFLLFFELAGELFAAIMSAPAFFSCREGVNMPHDYKKGIFIFFIYYIFILSFLLLLLLFRLF